MRTLAQLHRAGVQVVPRPQRPVLDHQVTIDVHPHTVIGLRLELIRPGTLVDRRGEPRREVTVPQAGRTTGVVPVLVHRLQALPGDDLTLQLTTIEVLRSPQTRAAHRLGGRRLDDCLLGSGGRCAVAHRDDEVVVGQPGGDIGVDVGEGRQRRGPVDRGVLGGRGRTDAAVHVVALRVLGRVPAQLDRTVAAHGGRDVRGRPGSRGLLRLGGGDGHLDRRSPRLTGLVHGDDGVVVGLAGLRSAVRVGRVDDRGDRLAVGEGLRGRGAVHVVVRGSLGRGPGQLHALLGSLGGEVGRRCRSRDLHLGVLRVDLDVGDLRVRAAGLVDGQLPVGDLDGPDGLVEDPCGGRVERREDRGALGTHEVGAVGVLGVADRRDDGVGAVGQVVLPGRLADEPDGPLGEVHVGDGGQAQVRGAGALAHVLADVERLAVSDGDPAEPGLGRVGQASVGGVPLRRVEAGGLEVDPLDELAVDLGDRHLGLDRLGEVAARIDRDDGVVVGLPGEDVLVGEFRRRQRLTAADPRTGRGDRRRRAAVDAVAHDVGRVTCVPRQVHARGARHGGEPRRRRRRRDVELLDREAFEGVGQRRVGGHVALGGEDAAEGRDAGDLLHEE